MKRTIKGILNVMDILEDSGVYEKSKGGIGATINIPYMVKGSLISERTLAYQINKWDIDNKKGWNLNDSSEKYMGALPDVGDIIKLYYWKDDELLTVDIIHIVDSVFKII